MNKVAIIAGTGSLPIEAAKKLSQSKTPLLSISLFPEDNFSTLQTAAPEAETIALDFYKPATILKLLKEKGVKKILLIGKVDKRNLLKKVKLDWLALKAFASIFSKGDQTIMEKIVSMLEDEGFEILRQSDVLKNLQLPPGIIVGAMTPYIEKNIRVGMEIAQKISEFDIGQTVVVKNEMVLAIEAIEGTDDCIRRGIELGVEQLVICKSAKESQNKKFDLPTLGPQTLKNIKPGVVSAIAWKADKALIAEQEKFFSLARSLGIVLVAT